MNCKADIPYKKNNNLIFMFPLADSETAAEGVAKFNCAWGLCAPLKQQTFQVQYVEVNTFQENQWRYRAMCWRTHYI